MCYFSNISSLISVEGKESFAITRTFRHFITKNDSCLYKIQQEITWLSLYKCFWLICHFLSAKNVNQDNGRRHEGKHWGQEHYKLPSISCCLHPRPKPNSAFLFCHQKATEIRQPNYKVMFIHQLTSILKQENHFSVLFLKERKTMEPNSSIII